MKKYILYVILLLCSCSTKRTIEKTTIKNDSVVQIKNKENHEKETITVQWYFGDSLISSEYIPYFLTPLSNETEDKDQMKMPKSGFIKITKSKKRETKEENRKIKTTNTSKKKTNIKTENKYNIKVIFGIASFIFAIIILFCVKNRSFLKKSFSKICKVRK